MHCEIEKNEWIGQFKYLDPIDDHHVKNGGLSFNKPIFSGHLNIAINNESKDDDNFQDMLSKCSNNSIIHDINKIITLNMAKSKKIPIFVEHIEIQNVHKTLYEKLHGKGVIDMLIKKQYETIVKIPVELSIIQPIIEKIYNTEKKLNSDIKKWNMWLLVDVRPIKKYHTQRNSGWHFDGLNIGGRYKNVKNVSIYTWTNKIPTLFYDGSINIPDNIDKQININNYAQKQIKETHRIIRTLPNCIYKFDGTTVHSGAEISEYIYDRVFIRVCFTQNNMFFDRTGNTANPYMEYPRNFCWRSVSDPSVTLNNIIDINEPKEFKNLWDVACFGHAAHSICNEGSKSVEYALIKFLKETKGLYFLNQVIKLYNQDDNMISCLRKELLRLKYFM